MIIKKKTVFNRSRHTRPLLSPL